MDNLISIYDDGSFALDMKYFDYTWADYMVSKNLEKHFGYPKRTPESKVLPHHEDIAAALQAKLEEVELNLLKSTYKKYGTQNHKLTIEEFKNRYKQTFKENLYKKFLDKCPPSKQNEKPYPFSLKETKKRKYICLISSIL